MRIKNHKKITCAIGALTTFTSMLFLTGEASGCDQVQRIVTNHYENLMKEREKAYTEEKQSLVQELNLQKQEKKLTEVELKSAIGGPEGIPIPEQVNKLRKSIDDNADTLEGALDSLKENLTDIPGNDLVSKLVGLKETLEATQEEKESSAQKYVKAKRVIAEIKVTTGGSGTGTPILPRLQKLCSVSETAKLLEERLRAISGDSVEDKVVGLKETLEANQKELEANQKEKEKLTQQYVEAQGQIAALKVEIGEEGGDTPPVSRVRTLSNSLKKDTSNLKEAINSFSGKLAHIPGEDCADKVDELMTTLALTQGFLNVIEQKLNGLPGDGLVEKLEILMEEREVTKVIMGNMQETITNKEEAYNDLHIELLRVKSQADYLDEELSKEQVAHSERREQLNRVVGIQFNGAAPTNHFFPTQREEINSLK